MRFYALAFVFWAAVFAIIGAGLFLIQGALELVGITNDVVRELVILVLMCGILAVLTVKSTEP